MCYFYDAVYNHHLFEVQAQALATFMVKGVNASAVITEVDGLL